MEAISIKRDELAALLFISSSKGSNTTNAKLNEYFGVDVIDSLLKKDLIRVMEKRYSGLTRRGNKLIDATLNILNVLNDKN